MEIAKIIAACIESLRYHDLPLTAVDNAKTVILDTIGCILIGSNQPIVNTLLTTPGLNCSGEASLPGRNEKLDPLCSALANGAAAHALDFDDVNIAIGGHPSAPVLSALIPLGEVFGYSGKDLLLAFIAGFETETRIARSVNFHHYEKGWHPTATLGVFGATAACAKLLDLSQDQIAVALAFATSLSSGVKANFGTMTKPFHVGQTARNGLMAALLAQRGFTANTEAFEHKQGFFNVYNGYGNYNPDLAYQNWAAPLDIVDPGIGIKLHPCCDSTHASVDALLTLKAQYGFSVEDVKKIDTWIHPLRLTHVNRPNVRTALDAKFSVQYCLARALHDGFLSIDSFSDSAYVEPSVIELMSRVFAHEHQNLDQTVDGNYLTDICVLLKDGRELRKHMDRPFGRHLTDPAPTHMIKSKFQKCAGSVLSEFYVEKLYDKLMKFELIEDIGHLRQLWAPESAIDDHG